MGYLRFYLALTVVMCHASYAWPGIGGCGAVEAFFVLSGLYMAAVYEAKYSVLANGARVFYLNRFLRLYPTYLFLLAFTGLCYLAMRASGAVEYPGGLFQLFTDSAALPDLKKWFVWISAFTLFGQDFQSVDVDLHYMLPVRQSWSIATELMFYLTVPFLFRVMTWKRALTAAVIFFAIKTGLSVKDWRLAYFLPVGNFGYFLFGYALYGLSTHAVIEKVKAQLAPYRLAVALALYIPLLNLGEASFELAPARHVIAIACVAGLALLLFEKTPRKLDLFLGNISYGVYLNHLLLVVLGKTMGLEGVLLAGWAATTSLILAFLMEKTLQEPIDRYRRRFTTLPAPSETR